MPLCLPLLLIATLHTGVIDDAPLLCAAMRHLLNRELCHRRGLTQVAWPTTCTTSLNGHLSGQEQGAANLAGENRADAPETRSVTAS